MFSQGWVIPVKRLTVSSTLSIPSNYFKRPYKNMCISVERIGKYALVQKLLTFFARRNNR